MLPRPQDIFHIFREQSAWRTSDGLVGYGELERLVRRQAMRLQSQGVKQGEHWAVRGWSGLDTFSILLAGMWQGITLHLVPNRLPASQQNFLMQQVPLQGCIEPSSDSPLAMADGLIEFQEERAAVGIFTSGSTGTPKSIMHSWRSLASSAQASNQFYRVEAGDSWLLSLDLAHIGGLQIAVRCFLAGAVAWHLAEPKAIATVLAEEQPAFLSLVPTQLYRLLADALACEHLRGCKAIILGGAAAAPELVDEALASALPVSVSYGSSETAAQCSALPPGMRPRHAGDVGQLLSGWDYQHAGETLRLRGPSAYHGFYRQRRFHPAADAAGWITLPDRILCEEGRLSILGRADGLFQVAGENISPAAIVQVLEPLRKTADFIVLPWPDAEYGAVPALIVRSPQEPALPDILDRLGRQLNGVQRPRLIYWHQSDDINKPSRSYYEQALQRQQLPLLWRQESGRV